MVSNDSTGGVDDAAFAELGERIRGALLRPGDEAFEAAARLWNAATQAEPAR